MYSLITLKEIDLNEYIIKNPFGVKSNLPELKLSKLELIDLVKFSNSLLNKIKFKKGLISLDLYKVKQKYLLGEFTLTPGALYFSIIGVKYLRDIFF